MTRIAALTLSAVLAPSVAAQTLVHDINIKHDFDNPDSDPSWFFSLGALTLFGADFEPYGDELWVTDGTTAGTTLLADIWPGPGDGNPRFFTMLDANTVVFRADHPLDGVEVWRTDGTVAGTYPIKDIQQPGAPYVGALTYFNGEVYFAADDGVVGTELWKTDGTEEGTTLVADLTPGPTGTFWYESVVLGNELLLNVSQETATPPLRDYSLWKTDGTTAGTTFVAHLNTEGFLAAAESPTEFNGKVYFGLWQPDTGSELWCTDGTTAGTGLLVDIEPGAGWSAPDNFVEVNGELLFDARTSATGWELWKTDGTVAGTVLVEDINPGPANAWPRGFTLIDGTLYFEAHDGVSGYEPWVSQGTAATTQLLMDIEPGTFTSSPDDFLPFGGLVYFVAADPTFGSELWATDGTPAGTAIAADIAPGSASSFPGPIVEHGGKLLLGLDYLDVGYELYETDGTAVGTQLLADLNQTGISIGSFPFDMTRAGHHVVYNALDKDDGREPHGTHAPTLDTQLLADASTQSSDPDFWGSIGPIALFTCDASSIGKELWRTDGAPDSSPSGGTFNLLDAAPLAADSGSAFLGILDDIAYFTTSAGIAPKALWRTDGTVAGTRVVLGAIPNGSVSVGPAAVVGDEIFLMIDDGVVGNELWRTDGSAAGTQLIADLVPGPNGLIVGQLDAARSFRAVGDELWFEADDGQVGREVWRSDGTAGGTGLFADLWVGASGSDPGHFTKAGDRVVFSADDGAGRRLYATDGTLPLVDLGPTNVWSTIYEASGFALLWTVNTPATAFWRTDGTVAGTYEVRPGLVGGSVAWDEVVRIGADDVFAFTASDQLLGEEVWRTDGTDAGTWLVADIWPGGQNSKAGGFARAGNRVFFGADDGLYGNEPHVLPLVAFDTWVAEPYGVACPGTGGLEPVISTSGAARVGENLGIHLDGALPTTAALLLYSSGGVEYLPVGSACRLHVGPTFAYEVALVDGAGSSSFTFPLPANPLLAGVEVSMQWLVADPGGAFAGIASLSHGLEVVIGP